MEKRRSHVIEKLQKNYSETSWLVDRYKFGHLMPCTSEELKSIGYPSKNANIALVANVNTSVESIPNPVSSVVLPNLTQMVPFKPKQNPGKLYYQFFIMKSHLLTFVLQSII